MHGSAVGQSIPIHGGVAVLVVAGVVLRGQSQVHIHVGAVSCVGGIAHVQGVPGADPSGVAAGVEGGGDLSQIAAGENLAVAVGDGQAGSGGVADGGEGHLVEAVDLRIDGITGSIIELVQTEGVAAEVVGLRFAHGLDGQGLIVYGIVTIIGIHIGGAGLQPVGIGDIAADIEHGGVGPAAIVAQHGDGVAVALLTLGGGGLVGEHIALHIGAGVVAGLVIGIQTQQSHIGGDVQAAAGGDHHGSSTQFLEEQVSIVGVDAVVVVEVSGVLMLDVGTHAGDIVQQSLTVIGIDLTVAVKVTIFQCIVQESSVFAVHGPLDVGGHGVGPGVLEVHTVGGHQILREEVGAQVEVSSLVLQIVDGEAEGVLAGAGGIVAQLYLDLAVGSAGVGALIHQDVGAGGNGIGHVGQTGTLTQHGIVAVAVLTVILHHGLGGGHQQGLSQLTGGETGLLGEIILTDVLSHQSGHTGDLRSGHGGAGHILIGTAVLQGVDVAARGGDLGLHLQRTGNAPAGEAAHGVVVGGGMVDSGGSTHGHGAGVVHKTGIGGVLLGAGLDVLAVGLQHGDIGGRVVIAIGSHADGAGLVVGYDQGNGTVGDGVVALVGEGDGATVADGDLTGEDILYGGKILGITGGVHIHELLLTGQSRQSLNGSAGGVGVEELLAGHFHVITGAAHVIYGGNAQRVGVGAGGAGGGPAVALGIGILVGSVLEPVAGVTGGDGHHGAAIGDVLHDGLISGIGVAGGAGVAAAQRQVHGISTQQDGVLNGGHVVGVFSAAVGAEHLHNEHLSIRSHALRQSGIQSGGEGAVLVLDEAVAGGNAGDVGAMVALLVVGVGDIQIVIHVVEAVGDLGVDVQLIGGDAGHLLGGVQLLQNGIRQISSGHQRGAAVLHGIGEGIGIQRGMVGVGTGIDDGHLGAGAGITVRPSHMGADHAAGGSHVGIGGLIVLHHAGLVAGLNEHGLDAGDLFDLFDLAVFHIGGDDVGRQSQVPDHIQSLTAQSLFGDGLSHLFLLGLQLLAVLHGRRIGSDILAGVTLRQRGGIFQNDGDTDYVGVCIFRSVLRHLLSVVLIQTQIGGTVVDLFPGEAVAGAAGRRLGGGPGGRDQTQAQNQSQQHGQCPLHGLCVFHKLTLSFPGVSRLELTIRCAGSGCPAAYRASMVLPIIARFGRDCNS